MAINITVHGNPDRHWLDLDYAKRDAERQKRLARLEQVRHQSKEIAAELRKKVYAERRRQQECLERCKAAELKSWQQRNVEKLQSDYEKCLKGVGRAHRAAKENENEEEYAKVRRQAQTAVATRRGWEAAKKLKREQNERLKRRQINRLKQKTVSTQADLALDSSPEVRRRSKSKSPKQNRTLRVIYPQQTLQSSCESLESTPIRVTERQPVEKLIHSSDEDEVKIVSDMTSTEESSSKQYEAPLDTRPFTQVSELIQKRRQVSPMRDDAAFNYDLMANVIKQNVLRQERPKTPVERVLTPKSPVKMPKPVQKVVKAAPTKPKVASKKVVEQPGTSTAASTAPKVQFYDMRNHFVKEYAPTEGIVRRVEPSEGEKNAMQNAVDKLREPPDPTKALRRQTTEARAQTALEKERAKREYEQLAAKLEALAKEDRIARAVEPRQSEVPKVSSEDQENYRMVGEDLLIPSMPPTKSRELSHIVYVEELKDLLERINEQKRLLLDEIQKDEATPNLNKFSETLSKLDAEKEKILEEKRRVEEKQAKETKDREEVSKSTSTAAPPVPPPQAPNPGNINVNFKKISQERERELAWREMKIKEREKRLEERIKELYKKQKAIKEAQKAATAPCPMRVQTKNLAPECVEVVEEASSSVSTTGETSSETIQNDSSAPCSSSAAPVKIIIKVDQRKTPTKKSTLIEPPIARRKKKVRQSQQPLASEGKGKVYPKTPVKRSILKKAPKSPERVKQSIQIREKTPERQKDSKRTIEKPITQQIQKIPLVDEPKSPEISSNSASTAYRSLPSTFGTELTKVLRDFDPNEAVKRLSEQRKTQMEAKQAFKKPSKPPQDNRNLNPALTQYIIRLLGMSRQAIDQLGVSTGSTISTPSESVVNISENMAAGSDGPDDRMARLKRFIDENYSFLHEVDESLQKVGLNGDLEETMSNVEDVWMRTLGDKERQMERKQKEIETRIQKPPWKAPSKSPMDLPSKVVTSPKKVSLKPAPKQAASPKKTPLPVTKKASLPVKKPPPLPQKPPKSILKSPKAKPKFVSSVRQALEVEADQISTGSKDESEILNKYAELTENCSKRIADLAEKIERCREEKRRLITEFSTSITSSGGVQDSTEYMELPQRPTQPPQEISQTSPESRLSYPQDDPPSEEVRNILQTKMRQMGVSKDSGISMSRPVTSTDFRESVEPGITGASPEFEPILKDIPKVSKLQDALQQFEGGLEALTKRKKDKPPVAITRFSPQLEEKLPAHELSTIIEVETPATSRINTSEPPAERPSFDPEGFVSYQDYLQRRLEESLRQEMELEGEVTVSDLQYQRYPSPAPSSSNLTPSVAEFDEVKEMERIAEELGTVVEVEGSSSPGSLPDIQEELKKRKILPDRPSSPRESPVNPFKDDLTELTRPPQAQVPFQEAEEKTTPTNTGTTSQTPPESPIRRPAQSRMGIRTPPLQDEPFIAPETQKTPTKQRPDRKSKLSPTKSSIQSELTGFAYLQKSIFAEAGQILEQELTEMGLHWAATEMKRTRQSLNVPSSSSTTSSSLDDPFPLPKTISDLTTTTDPDPEDIVKAKPISLREFIAKELVVRTKSDLSDDSSLSSQFLRSLMNLSSPTSSLSSNLGGAGTAPRDRSSQFKRTSTPMKSSTSSEERPEATPAPVQVVFSGESLISSVREGGNEAKVASSSTLSS